MNGEMAFYDTCDHVQPTAVVRCNDEGGWDVSLRSSGAPIEIARPTVLGIVARLNQRYSLKKPPE